MQPVHYVYQDNVVWVEEWKEEDEEEKHSFLFDQKEESFYNLFLYSDTEKTHWRTAA